MIFNDPDIHIVVELIGGIRPAKDLSKSDPKQEACCNSQPKAFLANRGADIFHAAVRQALEVGFGRRGGAILFIKVMKEV